jgi:hypothetical protein
LASRHLYKCQNIDAYRCTTLKVHENQRCTFHCIWSEEREAIVHKEQFPDHNIVMVYSECQAKLMIQPKLQLLREQLTVNKAKPSVNVLPTSGYPYFSSPFILNFNNFSTPLAFNNIDYLPFNLSTNSLPRTINENKTAEDKDVIMITNNDNSSNMFSIMRSVSNSSVENDCKAHIIVESDLTMENQNASNESDEEITKNTGYVEIKAEENDTISSDLHLVIRNKVIPLLISGIDNCTSFGGSKQKNAQFRTLIPTPEAEQVQKLLQPKNYLHLTKDTGFEAFRSNHNKVAKYLDLPFFLHSSVKNQILNESHDNFMSYSSQSAGVYFATNTGNLADNSDSNPTCSYSISDDQFKQFNIMKLDEKRKIKVASSDNNNKRQVVETGAEIDHKLKDLQQFVVHYFYGTKGTQAPFHIDSSPGIAKILNRNGEKLWMFFTWEEGKANGIIDEKLQLKSINIEKLYQLETFCWTIQNDAEYITVPSNYVHSVLNLTDNTSVNYPYCSADAIVNYCKFILTNDLQFDSFTQKSWKRTVGIVLRHNLKHWNNKLVQLKDKEKLQIEILADTLVNFTGKDNSELWQKFIKQYQIQSISVNPIQLDYATIMGNWKDEIEFYPRLSRGWFQEKRFYIYFYKSKSDKYRELDNRIENALKERIPKLGGIIVDSLEKSTMKDDKGIFLIVNKYEVNGHIDKFKEQLAQSNKGKEQKSDCSMEPRASETNKIQLKTSRHLQLMLPRFYTKVTSNCSDKNEILLNALQSTVKYKNEKRKQPELTNNHNTVSEPEYNNINMVQPKELYQHMTKDVIFMAYQRSIPILNSSFILEHVNSYLFPALSNRRDLPICLVPRTIIEDAEQRYRPLYYVYNPKDNIPTLPQVYLQLKLSTELLESQVRVYYIRRDIRKQLGLAKAHESTFNFNINIMKEYRKKHTVSESPRSLVTVDHVKLKQEKKQVYCQICDEIILGNGNIHIKYHKEHREKQLNDPANEKIDKHESELKAQRETELSTPLQDRIIYRFVRCYPNWEGTEDEFIMDGLYSQNPEYKIYLGKTVEILINQYHQIVQRIVYNWKRGDKQVSDDNCDPLLMKESLCPIPIPKDAIRLDEQRLTVTTNSSTNTGIRMSETENLFINQNLIGQSTESNIEKYIPRIWDTLNKYKNSVKPIIYSNDSEQIAKNKLILLLNLPSAKESNNYFHNISNLSHSLYKSIISESIQIIHTNQIINDLDIPNDLLLRNPSNLPTLGESKYESLLPEVIRVHFDSNRNIEYSSDLNDNSNIDDLHYTNLYLYNQPISICLGHFDTDLGYLYQVKGVKIWLELPFNTEDITHSKYPQAWDLDKLLRINTRRWFKTEPGDLVIIPPGVKHLVFTVGTSTVCYGGYFNNILGSIDWIDKLLYFKSKGHNSDKEVMARFRINNANNVTKIIYSIISTLNKKNGKLLNCKKHIQTIWKLRRESIISNNTDKQINKEIKEMVKILDEFVR